MAKFTVPTACGMFKEGQELTDNAVIVTYVRALASAMGQVIDHKSDAELMAAVNATADNEDTDEYVLELFSNIEAGEGAESTDDDVPPLADNLKGVGDKIANDKEIVLWVGKAIDGQKDVDRSPVFMADRVIRDLKPSEIACIPWPGSKQKIDGVPTGINNPDISYVERRKTDGTKKEVQVSAIKTLIGLQPRVAALRDAQDAIKDALPDKAKMNPEQKARYSNFGRQINSATRAYTLAFKLALLKSHLEDHKHVRLDFHTVESGEMDKEGNPVRILDPDMSTWCIDIVNRHNEKNFQTLTVAAVTRLNPSMITEHTTWTKVVDDLLARKKKEAAPTSLTKFVEPESVVEFEEFSSVAVNTLERPSMFSQVNVAMAHTAGEQKEIADAILLNIGRLEELCADLLKSKGRRTRLSELRRAEAAQGERPTEKEVA